MKVCEWLKRMSPDWSLFRPFHFPTSMRVFYEEVPVTPAPMALLSSGVPLSLLLDLFLGPDSEDLMSHERLPEPRDSRE
jgi:hypothetical protein